MGHVPVSKVLENTISPLNLKSPHGAHFAFNSPLQDNEEVQVNTSIDSTSHSVSSKSNFPDPIPSPRTDSATAIDSTPKSVKNFQNTSSTSHSTPIFSPSPRASQSGPPTVPTLNISPRQMAVSTVEEAWETARSMASLPGNDK